MEGHSKISHPSVFEDRSQSGMDRRIEVQRFSGKRLTLFAGAGLLAVLLTWSVFFADWSSKAEVSLEKLELATVTRGPFQEFVPITGSVLPIETFYLDAAVSGRVESVFVESGTMVKKGDPILKLANPSVQLDVMYREALSYEQINAARNMRLLMEQNTISLQAQLSETEFQVNRLRRDYVRDSLLFSKSLISPLEFQQSRDEFLYWTNRRTLAQENMRQDSLIRSQQIKQLEESINRMLANITMTRQTLENLTIRALIRGQLSSLNAEVGQLKSPGERLGQIDILDSFKVRVDVDEYYISRVQPGQRGKTLIADVPYNLAAIKVYPEVRDGRFELDMKFEGETPEGIRRGQTLQIRLELGNPTETVLLPRGAFFQKTAGLWIYVVDSSMSFAIKKAITVGRQNPDYIEVLNGLTPGMVAVISSYDAFGEADKLNLR